jgi:biotin synthase-like enzyme
VADIEALFNLPLTELIFRAQTVHREHFDPAEIELATLLSIKTGGCPRTAATARSRCTTTPASTPPS